jgi:hypothetical protein
VSGFIGEDDCAQSGASRLDRKMRATAKPAIELFVFT